ncbi:hypothetical protein BAUCODRAFT_79319 [Baudoinia panamericana UAMH 10762]|uniref:G-patch domain-containing protein n=1 Tax=Baudoinia panamericana (strain UAMH 10762) TaxID=717646 RepID=M2MK02_BAUPA|nr:uncharacterized protein BAUCODRAFT_79319 [Baudoinia panamericana UAMH 10762]EMC91658.1 hypothetical protein BAUCODRAFT_79319 [Baudoinia panamericana UAMH 10762]
MTDLDDDEYEIPLRDQRYFGSGVKRKRIQFVPSTPGTSIRSLPSPSVASAADRYLAIVLKRPQVATTAHEENLCDICHLPVAVSDATRHKTSIAHQVCLQHSHPPSDVDRTRKGLAVLERQGWDPDSRLGLGAAGDGRLHPVKAVENADRLGLGANREKVKKSERPAKLDAGKVKLLEKAKQKEAEALRNAFYRSEEVERYLGQQDRGAELP